MKFLLFLTATSFLYSCSLNQKNYNRSPQQVGEIGSSSAVKGTGIESVPVTLSDSDFYQGETSLKDALKNNDILLSIESDKNYFDSRRRKDRDMIQTIIAENNCLRQLTAGLMKASSIEGPKCDQGRPVYRLVYTLKNTKSISNPEESNQIRKYSVRYNCNEGQTRDQDFTSYTMIIKNEDAKKVSSDVFNTNICNAQSYITELQKDWKKKNP